jgi:hypothetical protein
VCSGTSPDERLVEMIELRDHPWFVATQAHPEFKSRPMDVTRSSRVHQGGARAQRAAAAAGEEQAQGRQGIVGASSSVVRVGSVAIGGGAPLAVIAGPCVIESRDAALRHAERLRGDRGRGRRRARLQIVLRQGEPDVDRRVPRRRDGRGLRILDDVRRATGLPVLTDVHESRRSRPSPPSSTCCRRPRSSAARPTSSSRSRRPGSR